MDRFDVVQADINAMARYWEDRKLEFLEPANELFMAFVDPAFRYGEEPYVGHDEFSMFFTEWVLFEFAFLERRTPLEEYAAHPPAGTEPARVARLGEIARSQFFSRFAILDKDPATETVVLSDVVTRRRYDVCDPVTCLQPRWRDGTIGVRIACADGAWHAVGQAHLYDRALPEHTDRDGPGFFHEEDRLIRPEAEHMGFYLRLLRDTVGIEGRYRHTASIRRDDPAGARHASP